MQSSIFHWSAWRTLNLYRAGGDCQFDLSLLDVKPFTAALLMA
jgi:hypothetical protein